LNDFSLNFFFLHTTKKKELHFSKETQLDFIQIIMAEILHAMKKECLAEFDKVNRFYAGLMKDRIRAEFFAEVAECAEKQHADALARADVDLSDESSTLVDITKWNDESSWANAEELMNDYCNLENEYVRILNAALEKKQRLDAYEIEFNETTK
jgi:hypothetical protein